MDVFLADLDLSPVVDRTIRQQILMRLMSLIVSGKLDPGQRLREQDLASTLGVSRAPLREALRDLVDVGLLVSVPYKGVHVRPIARKDLEELYSLRVALEQLAFRECWDKRSPAALADLRARNAALAETVSQGTDGTLAIEQELHLHSWCYELSGHALLLQAWERVKPNLNLYFSLHQHAHGRRGPLRQAHDAYLSFACGDDLDAMIAHLVDHMRQGFETTLELFD
ncbi:MAG: GntR family transcriptional regulator [Rhodospirillales bacterium]